MAKTTKSDDEWRAQLDPDTYQITRKAGTERAFTGKYWDTKEKGEYFCSCCGNRLFESSTKYDSGCGWPSFYEPVEASAVRTQQDDSAMMRRTEVLCADCDAHLGHVFPDGPQPTGLRYCMNSASLELKSEKDPD